jgi:hypothetical protein
MGPCNYGFRILGPTWARRRLVDAAVAFAAYATCDARSQPELEAYLSAFDYDGAFRRHLEETRSTRGYTGPCGGRYLWFDIDLPDELAVSQSTRCKELRNGRVASRWLIASRILRWPA